MRVLSSMQQGCGRLGQQKRRSEDGWKQISKQGSARARERERVRLVFCLRLEMGKGI